MREKSNNTHQLVNMNRYAVIIAGGKGERFWPQSRLSRPKHLLPIVGNKEMLLQAIDRFEGFIPDENIIIITNAEQVEAINSLCPNIKKENIFAEPIGRDTAAAVALATLIIKSKNPHAIFAILPADHVINDTIAFRNCIEQAYSVAEKYPSLITLGIKPTIPATGYGYIQKGNSIGERTFSVKRFVEKPNKESAQKYLDSGDYLWNAGMFIWKVETIENALIEHCHDLYKKMQPLETILKNGGNFSTTLKEIYLGLEKISIDYAVMEKAENVFTIEATFDWDDVGEWPAIERHSEADSQGNVVRGNAILSESNRNIVLNENGHLTAVLGIDDLIIIQTKDATLICPKNKSQEIKALVQKISADPKTASCT